MGVLTVSSSYTKPENAMMSRFLVDSCTGREHVGWCIHAQCNVASLHFLFKRMCGPPADVRASHAVSVSKVVAMLGEGGALEGSPSPCS